MFTLFNRLGRNELLFRQLPSLVAALAIAELFYKFHSFALECLAFLATWFVLDALAHLLGRLIGTRPGTRPSLRPGTRPSLRE